MFVGVVTVTWVIRLPAAVAPQRHESLRGRPWSVPEYSDTHTADFMVIAGQNRNSQCCRGVAPTESTAPTASCMIDDGMCLSMQWVITICHYLESLSIIPCFLQTSFPAHMKTYHTVVSHICI